MKAKIERIDNMNIITEQSYTVFRNDYNQYTFYKLGISKRDATGKWINGYIRCKFKKDVVVENKTRIYLKKAWLSFDLKEKETMPFIFISEFETIDETIENSKKSAEKSAEEPQRTAEDPFKDFGEEITLSDDDLPF